MKYLKYLALAVFALALGSCSDDDSDWNTTADTTVSLPAEGVTIKETKGIYKIPVQVSGARNGAVKVTVEVKETGANPAKEDVNYMLTSKTSIVGADTVSTDGYIELETIDDQDINEDRTFEMTIVSAEGAKIGNASTIVTIKDNDSNPYDRLQGTYTLTAPSPFDESTIKETVKIEAPEASSSDYGKKLYLTGMNGHDWNYLVLNYKYDEDTGEGSIYATIPQTNVTGQNFGADAPSADITLYAINTAGKLSTENITGQWNAGFTEITFDNGLYAAVFYKGKNIGGWFGYGPGIKLTKSK